MQQVHSADTDVIIQLVLAFATFVERRSAEVADGNAAARAQCNQEDQAPSVRVQPVFEQVPRVEGELRQVRLTPASGRDGAKIINIHRRLNIHD